MVLDEVAPFGRWRLVERQNLAKLVVRIIACIPLAARGHGLKPPPALGGAPSSHGLKPPPALGFSQHVVEGGEREGDRRKEKEKREG